MDLSKIMKENISITEFILRRFQGHEHKVGMVDGDTGEEWTLGDIRENVGKVGSAMARRGLVKGDVVATIAPNCLDHMAALFAIPSIGGIVSGMNPLYTSDEIRRQLEDCEARFVITIPQLLSKVVPAVKKCPRVKEIILIGKSDGFVTIRDLMQDDGSFRPKVEFDIENDLAFLPYSSGTTGLPKGVMLTHRAIMTQLHLFSDYPEFAFVEMDRSIITMFPFYHIGGLGFCAVGLFQRCKSILIRSYDFEAFLQLVEKYKTDTLVLPPPVILRMAKDPLVDKYNMSSVKHMIAGAAPVAEVVQREVANRFNVHNVRQAYGMTETCGATHTSRTDNSPAHGSCGTNHPVIKCKIIDTNTGEELVGPGKKGEIWVHTPCAMKGYWKSPEKTRTTLDENGWIHTGDVAYADKDGNFYIVDRVKELIKYKGFQVAPAELEALLLTHPDIADAAVIGLPDQRSGEVPAAYVVLKDGRPSDQKNILEYVAERAAYYKHLRGGVHFRDSIPKNLSGKILRRVLRDEVMRQLKASAKL